MLRSLMISIFLFLIFQTSVVFAKTDIVQQQPITVIEKSAFEKAYMVIPKHPYTDAEENDYPTGALKIWFIGIEKDTLQKDSDLRGLVVVIPWGNTNLIVDSTTKKVGISYTRKQRQQRVEKATLTFPSEEVKQRWIVLTEKRKAEYQNEFWSARREIIRKREFERQNKKPQDNQSELVYPK